MAVVKASNYKNWCSENISPQSWIRILLKNMDMIREKGLTLNQLEDINPDVDIDPQLLEALNQSLHDLYEISVDESLLALY